MTRARARQGRGVGNGGSIGGFTLIELIVVMVILGIIVAISTRFISGPTLAYLSSTRRAQMSDVADVAIRRIARDLRVALPNSVRAGASNRFLEYIPTTHGARYRAEAGGAAGSDHLDFAAADTSFDYIGADLAGATGHVVVFNTGQRSVGGCANAAGGADAYEGCNRSAISAITASLVSMASRQFRLASPGNRFHVVPATGPVTLACENVGDANGNGTGTLRMYTNYATGAGDWGAGAPAGAPAAAGRQVSVLANNVSACALVYVSGISASNGLATLRLAISREGETLVLHHQIHVDNVP